AAAAPPRTPVPPPTRERVEPGPSRRSLPHLLRSESREGQAEESRNRERSVVGRGVDDLVDRLSGDPLVPAEAHEGRDDVLRGGCCRRLRGGGRAGGREDLAGERDDDEFGGLRPDAGDLAE